jgi:hypothetical protein
MSTIAQYPDRLDVRAQDNAYLGVVVPRKTRDGALIDIGRLTGYSYPAYLADISRLVVWLVGVVGRQPEVEGYGNRTPVEGPVLTLLHPGQGMGHGDTMALAHIDGRVVVQIKHHSPGQQHVTAHFAAADLGPLLDWLAEAHKDIADRQRAEAGR